MSPIQRPTAHETSRGRAFERGSLPRRSDLGEPRRSNQKEVSMRRASLVFALLFAACSSGGGGGGAGGGGGGTGGAGGGGGGGTGGAGGQAITLTMGPFTVPAGMEVYKCQDFA